jgi:hypothetical protein
MVLCALGGLFLVLDACAVKEKGPAEACNCDTAGISAEEEAEGCTAEIKERQCRLYQEKERLQLEQERRRMEKSMEPRHVPQK